MIKKILVPTDFSACAENAAKFAGKLAEQFKAEVTLYHIYAIPVVDPVVPSGSMELYLKETELAAKAGLKKSIDKFQKAFPAVVVKGKTKTGFAIQEIIGHAKKSSIDLIVMGTTGASGFEELLVGSNTASILEKADCPVLAVPAKSKFSDIKNILYTTDLTMPESRTFSRLLELGKAFSATITVLHVKSEMDRYFKLSDIRFENYGKMAGYNKVKYDEISSEKVFDAINRYIAKGNFDVVAMATHSRGFFDKLFHRSLTKRMAYHTKIPLLSFKKD
ncbi:MAG: universal stress protein [Bacteroidia bacterium]|jgi:nucleotide-binding universal stress UspA family protein|nr:universal stress protein [Bacteroidia bacterium]MBP7259832.1 universal stress protein [Bacteroidia bacterium]MBP9178928.1 universal stress protein [Bacteroidia bacterium]MBP9723229.1 universal stress protein [Bacteroidia bacterium]